MVRNYYTDRKTLKTLTENLKGLEIDMYCASHNRDDKELGIIEAKRCDLLMTMNEIIQTINTKFHVKVDGGFRCFNNSEFDIPIRLGDVNYIVGSNGSGKSTILQTIRANKDSLFEINKKELDGMTSQNIQMLKGAPITIDGIDDKFTHVFSLDAIEDDPCNFINAATAFGFINGGGLNATNSSKGQKTQHMLGNLFTKMQNVLNFTFEDHKNYKLLTDSASLILIDEIDEGLDLENLFKFDHLLRNLCMVFNGTVICVTHNPLVCYGNELRGEYPVFDLDLLKEITIKDYIQNKTGLKFEIYD
jgi:ATPase subunit of ABC transporter with duplicated ATPase domains